MYGKTVQTPCMEIYTLNINTIYNYHHINSVQKITTTVATLASATTGCSLNKTPIASCFKTIFFHSYCTKRSKRIPYICNLKSPEMEA